MRAAAAFAWKVGTPLTAHATIHWSLTDAGDDPRGQLLAKVREGLSKALRRRGIPFAAIWVRERRSGGRSECEHAHMVFHLPSQWWTDKRLAEIVQVLERLIGCQAGQFYEHTLRLVIHTNGDIRYLLKGTEPRVRQELGIKRKWRQPQGIIIGKRGGFTQNLGPAARRRHRDQSPGQKVSTSSKEPARDVGGITPCITT